MSNLFLKVGFVTAFMTKVCILDTQTPKLQEFWTQSVKENIFFRISEKNFLHSPKIVKRNRILWELSHGVLGTIGSGNQETRCPGIQDTGFLWKQNIMAIHLLA